MIATAKAKAEPATEGGSGGRELALFGQTKFSLVPRTLDEAMKFAELIASSSIVPTAYRGKPGDVLVAVQMGAEVGLHPLQALQNLAVINGKPCMYGDSLLAVVQASGLLGSIEETDDGETATCIVKRRGDPCPKIGRFSMADAKRAGLLGKQGPWQTYPARMRQMRARGFALRDGFADALKGMIAREEAEDCSATKPAEVVSVSDAMPRRTAPAAEPIVCIEGPQAGEAGAAPAVSPAPAAEASREAQAHSTAAPPAPSAPASNGHISEQDRADLFRLVSALRLGMTECKAIIAKHGFKNSTQITKAALPQILAELNALAGAPAGGA